MTARSLVAAAERGLVLASAAAAFAVGAPASAAEGLAPPSGDLLWPTWQARLSVTTSGPSQLWSSSLADTRRLRQASLLGDMYVGRQWFGASPRWRGALRATGGLVLGSLGSAMASGGATSVNLWSLTEPVPDAAAAGLALRPYVGVGYAGLSERGGWGLSADLGVLAGEPGALFGADAPSSVLRRLDLQPVVRFGLSVAF
jgi:hypothetical protein